MKTIETKRLILRGWQESDVTDLYEYASDDRVGPSAGWAPHKNEAESKKIIDSFIDGGEVYAVVLKAENKVIGSLGLHDRKPAEFVKDVPQREIGYVLSPKYWGEGYIPEAVGEVIKYGFEELNLEVIWCGHFDFNQKSRRVNEKCGFKHRFTMQKTLPLLDNRIVESLVYSITKEDYFNNS